MCCICFRSGFNGERFYATGSGISLLLPSLKTKQPLAIRAAIYSVGIVIAGLIALGAYSGILWTSNEQKIVFMLLKFGWIMALVFSSVICLALLGIALAAHVQWRDFRQNGTALKMDEHLFCLRNARAEAIACFGTYDIRLMPAVEKAIEQHVATHEPRSIDYRIRGCDGTLRWFHDESRMVTNTYATPSFRQGILFNITARKQAQEELAKSHEELKKLIGALDAMREEEQKRLAREMHDDLGQLLAAMRMDLCDLQQYLPKNDAKATERMHDIQELVTTMVISVRRIIADLPPKILEDLGLFPALREMTANFKKRHQIICALHLPVLETIFDQRLATEVYRMVQEAMNNVVRHAAATQVKIKLDVSDGNLIVTVSDNGTGMMVDASRKVDSFGLIGIRERVTALRGTLKIASMPGTGTMVSITLPLDSSSTAQT